MKNPSAISSAGLLAGVAGVAKNVVGLLISRIELAALELAEVRSNFLELILICCVGLIAMCFALAYWSALAVFLAWDTWGWKALLVMACLFTLVTAGLFFYACSVMKQSKFSLYATLNELRHDRDALVHGAGNDD